MPKEIKMQYIRRNTHAGKGLAVMTSGGDSQGMNAALRACIRVALYLDCKAYFIHEGYSGMVEGGDNFEEAHWFSVSSILQRSGTVIGSARCPEFIKREGRLQGAKNMVERGITNLVVIGGDGSLTGANLFRQEWSSLLEDLVASKDITQEQFNKSKVLHIVGIVGSIDNDFCCTDMTIGCDSALFRICEACDAIVSTAYSHKRTFIMEVMGRHCGYLAIVSSVACEADFMFIPESPPGPDWPDQLCENLSEERTRGKRLSIVIIAEGAVDSEGTPITSQEVKKVLEDRLNMDTRITVVGHIQRGGKPSAFDRILAARMGAEATFALLEATDQSPSLFIALRGNRIIRAPLMLCVERTHAVTRAMEEKNWELAVKLRGNTFARNLRTFNLLSKYPSETQTEPGRRIAVLLIGSPACGMNAAVRSFVRCSINQGYSVVGVQDGMDGLIEGRFCKLGWSDVIGWSGQGGAKLGTKDTLPEGHFKEIAEHLRKLCIDGILVIGGFEGFISLQQLAEQRCNYCEFCIPMVMIPATINNNIPGTEFSLGSDSSLNEITEICDRIRQSAQGTNHRVFVVETMGGFCGYLPTAAAMASGADASYIFEEKFGADKLQDDIHNLTQKICNGIQRGLVLSGEKASENYNSDFIRRIYAEEGKEYFTCRLNVLGHNQQGYIPSPFDRCMGAKFGAKCVDYFNTHFSKCVKCDGSIRCKGSSSVCVLGLGYHSRFTPLADLICDTDFKHRMPKHQWWLAFRPLARILSVHESIYKEEEGMYFAAKEDWPEVDKAACTCLNDQSDTPIVNVKLQETDHD